MYLINNDTYECDFCGVKMKWDAASETNGDMWGCEKCGATFCSKCLIDAIGYTKYLAMMQNSDLIYCPNCAKQIEIEGETQK